MAISDQFEKREKPRANALETPENKTARKVALAFGGLELWRIHREKEPRAKSKEKPIPLQITIGDLREQERVLTEEKKGIEKRDETFRTAEKDTLKKLEPFKEDRPELRNALAWKIHFGPEKIDPKQKESFEKTLAKFDQVFSLAGRPAEERTRTYLAAYTVLSEEQMTETEKQLHGTREACFKSATDVSVHAEDIGKLFAENKASLPKLHDILANQHLSDEERMQQFSGALQAIDNPKYKKQFGEFRKSLGNFAENDAAVNAAQEALFRLKREAERFSEFKSRQQEHPERILEHYGALEAEKREEFKRKETPRES